MNVIVCIVIIVFVAIDDINLELLLLFVETIILNQINVDRVFCYYYYHIYIMIY